VGLPKIQTDLLGRFFVDFPSVLRVRKLAVENKYRFVHLRTFWEMYCFLFLCDLIYSHGNSKKYFIV